MRDHHGMRPRQTFTVCGKFQGQDISVPGHEHRLDAERYATRKGWREVRVIRG